MGSELKDVRGLRARRPEQVRRAPSREDTLRLLKTVEEQAGFTVSLVARLLYGCGLRVTEPLNLRVKDVELEEGRLIIRSAKGGKDRVVPIPCAAQNDLREQMEAAQVIWKRDQFDRMPVALPHQPNHRS